MAAAGKADHAAVAGKPKILVPEQAAAADSGGGVFSLAHLICPLPTNPYHLLLIFEMLVFGW